MWYAIVAILILIADQGLKYWVTLNIPLDTGHVTLIPGVLELTNIHNNGAAFSILQHAPHWLFVIFTVVFAAIAVFCLRRNIVHGKVGRWSVVLVLAGFVPVVSLVFASLPEAVLEVKQAAGRLIRSSTDCGVLILADPRLVTKGCLLYTSPSPRD